MQLQRDTMLAAKMHAEGCQDTPIAYRAHKAASFPSPGQGLALMHA